MFQIRQAMNTDSQPMLDIYAPVIEKTATSFEFTVPTVEEFQYRVSKILEQLPWLVCTNGPSVAGYAYAGSHRSREAYQWSAELSVYIDPLYHRRGIARALYTALAGILKLQGFYTALAGITLPNDTSVGFHEAFGFKPVGIYHNVGHKFGRWHSVGWWEYQLQPYKSDPVPPVTIKDIAGTLECNRLIRSATEMIKH